MDSVNGLESHPGPGSISDAVRYNDDVQCCGNPNSTNNDSNKSIATIKRRPNEVATARWAILRDALLQKSSQSSRRNHSIHSFLGYNLLRKHSSSSRTSTSTNDVCNNPDDPMKRLLLRIEPPWNGCHWDKTESLDCNLERLEIAIMALAACYPKGKCLDVVVMTTASASTSTKDSLQDKMRNSLSTTDWFDSIRNRCKESFCLWNVKEVVTIEYCPATTTISQWQTTTTTTTTVLVQESSCSTKYEVCYYNLNDNGKSTSSNSVEDNFTSEYDSTVLNVNNSCILWTREPRETKLSLDDLVSHRKTGVDNTGNICVWDSERTLAYLLFHHLHDLPAILVSSLKADSTTTTTTTTTTEVCNILELGTGMAGLAATSLGLRLVLDDHSTRSINSSRHFNITLTDGNASGVKNNIVNQYLTNLYSQTEQEHPYQSLNVNCELLLWDATIGLTESSVAASTLYPSSQHVILVSDCIHFQDFHAALAITSLYLLRVGGFAIYCQPTRGDSLENFVTLLQFANSTPVTGPPPLEKESTTISTERNLLLSFMWWSHPVLDARHELAIKDDDTYEESLHHPKILIVTKLRELAESDRQMLIQHQQSRQVI
jgi:hypothetical protein